MKFYIATRLENHLQHNTVRDFLIVAGHSITYDWTSHGPVWKAGTKVIREVACAELNGVVEADVVVVLLPGGRGTHAELGMAIALGKPVLLCGGPEMYGAVPETCAFYHHPLVLHLPLWVMDELEFFVERWPQTAPAPTESIQPIIGREELPRMPKA